MLDRVPPELSGRPAFVGRWIERTPGGDAVYADASDPRFLMRIPLKTLRRIDFIDLGQGVDVETLAFLETGRELLLVASAHDLSASLVARALLQVDVEAGTLLDVIALPRKAVSRGLAVDSSRRRVFLLEDEGGGVGRVRAVDLYRGRILAESAVGGVPAAVGRKGLALARGGRRLYCLSGGVASRSDFEPRAAGEPGPPEVVFLDADSLRATERVPLDPDFSPAVLALDEDRDRLYVLEVSTERSRVVVVDAAFASVRARVDLPDAATDLVLAAGYAFAPGPYGIHAIDLVSESRAGGTAVPFDITREMVVTPDLATALVMFQSTTDGGPPGIAAVGLTTGEILDVLQ